MSCRHQTTATQNVEEGEPRQFDLQLRYDIEPSLRLNDGLQPSAGLQMNKRKSMTIEAILPFHQRDRGRRGKKSVGMETVNDNKRFRNQSSPP